MPTASEMLESCSRNDDSESQGSRKPGVWEPCPGHTMTITVLVCQSSAARMCRTDTKYSEILCGCLQTPSAAAGRIGLVDRTHDECSLQYQRFPGTGRIPSDHLGDPLEAVPNGVRMDEELTSGGFQRTSVVEIAPQRRQ